MARRRTSRMWVGVVAAAWSVAAGAPAAGKGGVTPQAETTVVSYTGQLSSTIPLAVPGYKGLEPKLALAYQSTQRNGFVGLGWDLRGVSVIERASPGKGAPRYDATDIYLLDGNELLACTSLGGTHCTRVQSYQRITRDAGNDRWYVWQRDGVKLTFEAKFTTASGTYRWYLTRAEDGLGNHAAYSYFCDGTPVKECYFDQVQWGWTGAEYTYEVRLYREARTDKVTYGTGAGLASLEYRLKSVAVRASSGGSYQLVRAYKLTYGSSAATQRSLVTAVQQYGKDATVDAAGTVTGGTTLPPIGLGYAEEQTGFQPTGWAFWWDYGGFHTDVVGSGRSSVVWSGYVIDYTANDFATRFTYTTYPYPFGEDAIIRSHDFTGDGKSDLLYFDSAYPDYPAPAYLRVMTSAGNSFASMTTWGRLGTPYDNNWLQGAGFLPGDFNGDGRTDLLWVNTGGLIEMVKSNGTSFTPAQSVGTFGNGDAARYRVADVNGDGRTDILYVGTDATLWVRLALPDGTGFGPATTWLTHGNAVAGNYQVEDFNGDGRADVLYVNGSVFEVGLSSGASFVSPTAWGSASGYQMRRVADLDGDGRADIVLSYGTYDVITVNALLSRGTSFTAETTWGSHYFGGSAWISHPVYPANPIAEFSGDGKVDYVAGALWCGFGCSAASHMFLGKPGVGPLLTSITNGLGGTTSVSYTPSTTWSNTYLPTGMVFPTVASVTTSDGRGDVQTTTYAYQGALWSAASREFLGFRKTTTTVGATGAYAETYYWQRVGTIAKPEVIYKRRPGGAIMSFDKFVFTENASPPYTSLVTEMWSYECNGDGVVDANHNYVSGCRRTLMTFEWDQYANLVRENQHGDYDLAGDERTAYRSFAPNLTGYVVGLPAYDHVYRGLSTASENLESATRFYYDGATDYATPPAAGQLTKKTQWLSTDGSWPAHSFGYDAAGNQTSMTDPQTRTGTKQYDAVGRVTRLVDPAGYATTTSYDPVLGLPASQTDINGQVTSHGYDALGRPAVTTAPDGSQVKVECLDWGTVAAQRIRTSKSLPGGAWLWEDGYFDGLGRPYKSVDQSGVTQETIYGATGKAWKQSLPYVSGETVRYDEHTYDEMGRELTVKRPDGATVTRGYGDAWATATDALGRTRTSYTDVYGRVTKAREVIGGVSRDTTFFYDVVGRRTKSIDAAGYVTVVSYDSLGRAVQKSDPDQGVWSYGYDALGRVTRETDALLRSTDVFHDALGRVTKRKYHDGVWDRYVFDEAGGGVSKGRLTTSVSRCSAGDQVSCVLGADSVTTTAAYDLMGRRTAYSTRLGSGTTATVRHGYDLAGRLASVTYPDGEVVTYGYGTSGLAAGRLVTVSGSVAGALVSGVTFTARGQAATVTHGNGVTTTQTFDAYGERVASIAYGSLGTLSYGYDANGRVTAQSSAAFPSSNWSYGYDEVGRLTQATQGWDAARSRSYRYDAVGRMLCNSKQGSYSYADAAHPHAVTAAGAQTYGYDANGNLTNGAGRVISYDLDHRPLSVTAGGQTTSFVYDAQGVRVRKSGPAGTVQYVGGLYEDRGGAVTKYYFAGSQRVAKRSGSATHWFHQDHLGSTRLLTDASGAQVKHLDYAPFGKVLANAGTVSESHGYTGQEADDETGLMYFRARYYDTSLGRFVQPDSLLPEASNPQALDPYAYALNNPITVADPSGHLPVAAGIVAGLVGHYVLGLTVLSAVVFGIGCALTFTNDPFLQSIGMVLTGWVIGGQFGTGAFGMSPETIGALVSLAQSPISPLDPTIKKAIGWAYTAWGFVNTVKQMANQTLGEALGTDKLGKWLSDKTGGVLGWAASGGEKLGMAGAILTSAVKEAAMTAGGWALAYASSGWGTTARWVFAFAGRAFVLGSMASPGTLSFVGATYDLAYTLKYPDGRIIDLSGGVGGEAFTFYYHTGFEMNLGLGRQHIRVGDPQGGYWELGDARAGWFGAGLGWGGWVTTQKVTVILSPAQAAAFRGALQGAAQSGGRYEGFHADSYTYVSAALTFATGKSAADLHINPGLLHW